MERPLSWSAPSTTTRSPCTIVPKRLNRYNTNKEDLMTTKENLMAMPGVPVGGLKTVGQIDATNPLVFYAGQNGLAIAVELLSTHTAGAPVVNHEGKYIGFINEFDVMKALAMGKELSNLIAEDLMRVGPIAVHSSTTIADAAQRMDEQCVLNLPVEKDGKVAYSVSRHDLLRAWIGLGLGMGLDP
jgi:predicted transcriptional regulator